MRWALGTTKDALDQIDSAVKGVNFSVVQSVMATQHATKMEEHELIHHLVLWTVGKDGNGEWLFQVSSENPIHYSILTDYVAKKLSEKAASLTIQKRKTLISDLKEESAASAYRRVMFEADAIGRLVRGGPIKLYQCCTGDVEPIPLTLKNTGSLFPMQDLDSLSVTDAVNQIVVPDARNFELVDAFQIDSSSPQKEMLLFQMTVEQTYLTKYNGVTQIMDKIQKSSRIILSPASLCILLFWVMLKTIITPHNL